MNLIRVMLASLVFLLPGLLIERAVLGGIARGLAVRFSVAGATGLGALGLYLWTIQGIDVSLGVLLGVWTGFWVITGGVVFLLRKRNTPASPVSSEPPDLSGRTGAWLLGLCILGGLVAIPFGTYISGNADAWEYLNRASAILRADRLAADSPYDPALHSPYDPTFYGIIALLSRLSGVAPADLWQCFPVVATPIEIGMIATAAGIITRSGPAGLLAAIVYTVFYGPFFLFRNSVHHQMLADALYLLTLAVLFLYLRDGRKKFLLIGGLSAAAATTLHHFLVVQSAFAVGLSGIVLVLTARHRKALPLRPVAYTAAVAACLIPAVVALLTTHLSSVDPKAMDDFFRDYAPLRHFGPLYIPDPFPWFFKTFWHPIPALLLVFHFGRRLFADERALVLGTILWAPVLTVMNPLVFPVMAEAVGLQVATRILNLTAYPGVLLMGWILSERTNRLRGLILVALSLLMVLPQTLIRIQGDYGKEPRARELAESPMRWRPALEILSAETPPGSVVLSDPVTSYSIPTFAPLHIVVNARADFAFQAEDFERRRWATDTVLDPLGEPDSAYAALRRYNVSRIVVNRLFANPLVVDKLDMMAGSAPGLARLFQHDPLLVYAVDPERLPAEGPASSALRSRLLVDPATFSSFLEPGTGITFDRASGVGGVMGPEEAALGDTLYITFYYEWRADDPGSNWYAKLVRDDAYGSSWRKFRRQIRGSILGQPESILFVRDLHYAAFRRRSIPPGFVFADQFLIAVPPDMVPGRYSLRVAQGTFPTEGAMGLHLATVDIARRRNF